MNNKNIQLVSSVKMDQDDSKELTNVYTFDEFTLDIPKKKLFKDGKNIRIEKRMFLLLKLLISNSPEAQKKDELMEQLWENQVVTDWSLSRLVSDARKILGDDGKSQKYIRTVRGEGFSFSGHLVRLDTTDKIIGRRNTSDLTQESKKFNFKTITLFAFLIFLGLLLALNQYKYSQEIKKIQVIKELQENLLATKIAHSVHDKRGNELTKLIDNRIGIDPDLEWENIFVIYYSELTPNELFICEQIRAITEKTFYHGNKKNLSILLDNPDLKNDLPSYQALVNHLKFWLGKFENVYLKRKDMCLMTTGTDGVPFPKQIDNEISNLLLKYD